MKKKLSLIISSVVLVIFVLLSFFVFNKTNNGIKQTIANNEIKLNTVFYKASNKTGGALFVTDDKGENAYTALANNLSKTGLDVITLKLNKSDSENNKKIDLALQELKEKSNLENSDIILAGYDVGGFELLKYVSKSNEKFAGAVFLSPYFQQYDEKSVAIDNGSYVIDIPWVNNLNKDSFNFPVLILSTTTDDYSTPQLMTMLYNHLSSDDIQRSVGAFNARNGNISLVIETGVLHNFIPTSDNIFQKIQNFIINETNLETAKINTNMYFQNILWCGIILSAICVIVTVYNSVKFKFSDVSMGIISAKVRSGWIYFLIKIVTIIISIILMMIVSAIATKVFKNISSATSAVASFVGISGIVSLAFFKKFILHKDSKLFKSNLININYKNLVISLLVVIFDVLVIMSILLTGHFYTVPTNNVILQGIYVFIMSFIGIYAYVYEIDTIRAVSKEKYVDIIYELIILLPFAIIFLWYVVTAQYALSYVAITNIIAFIIAIVSSFVMKEINGNRSFTSVIMALYYTFCVILI